MTTTMMASMTAVADTENFMNLITAPERPTAIDAVSSTARTRPSFSQPAHLHSMYRRITGTNAHQGLIPDFLKSGYSPTMKRASTTTYGQPDAPKNMVPKMFQTFCIQQKSMDGIY